MTYLLYDMFQIDISNIDISKIDMSICLTFYMEYTILLKNYMLLKQQKWRKYELQIFNKNTSF